ncbi:MAG: DUF1573 domain-containing protein [Planctomycetales bacterium]|nr:DUF1573 domain-containing protein [Planctomycetales bacterium]
MLRILYCILLGAAVGAGLGWVQVLWATTGYEERFGGSRQTLAERRGEKTREEVQAEASGKPVVEVIGGAEYLFGTMQHGQSLSHEFIFRNAGDGPLNLEMGQSTCKCTVGELNSSVLQPGEQTPVTLTWTAQAVMPDFGQSATIHTNDPAHPEVQLYVRGQIADSFVVEPSSLNLGDIAVADTVQRTFHVFTYLEDSEAIDNFAWSDAKTSNLVKFSVRKVDLDAAQFPDHPHAFAVHEVQVNIAAGLPLGPIHPSITFSTDQGDKIGIIEVPVTGRVTGDIMVVGGPSYDSNRSLLTIGTVRSNVGAEVSLTLSVQGAQRDQVQPEVVSINPEDALQVTVGEGKLVGTRKFFPIRFVVPKGAPVANYAGSNPQDFGKVLLRTNHDFIQEIPIFIRLNVTK